jgi:hypothetical protein
VQRQAPGSVRQFHPRLRAASGAAAERQATPLPPKSRQRKHRGQDQKVEEHVEKPEKHACYRKTEKEQDKSEQELPIEHMLKNTPDKDKEH